MRAFHWKFLTKPGTRWAGKNSRVFGAMVALSLPASHLGSRHCGNSFGTADRLRWQSEDARDSKDGNARTTDNVVIGSGLLRLESQRSRIYLAGLLVPGYSRETPGAGRHQSMGRKGYGHLFEWQTFNETFQHMRKTLLIIFLALTTGRADAEDMTRKEIKHEDGEKTIETYDSKGRLIELHDLDNSAKLTRRFTTNIIPLVKIPSDGF